MESEFQWMIGAALTVLLALGGVIIRALRSMSDDVSTKISRIHERVDGIKDTYVRRDDLFVHLEHIEKSLVDLKQDGIAREERLMKAINSHEIRCSGFKPIRPDKPSSESKG